MYRVFGFLTKRDGLSLPEFKDYYENHHVPLLLSKAPKPPVHTRRYVNRDEELIRLLDRARLRLVPRLRKNLAEALLSWPSRSAMRRIARARVRGIAPPDCISSAACTSIILAALLDGSEQTVSAHRYRDR